MLEPSPLQTNPIAEESATCEPEPPANKTKVGEGLLEARWATLMPWSQQLDRLKSQLEEAQCQEKVARG
ncbi:hypothetical protein B296_00019596 [Ensete ventricosum]|uniref:Uncharacterized protein n=1 Tax=Ensete ventricosum TaxID=4639 RepID=A0A427B2F9_ENSVE|nr:hypothetical protein B296_00019596 [Ensete ventricosum]